MKKFLRQISALILAGTMIGFSTAQDGEKEAESPSEKEAPTDDFSSALALFPKGIPCKDVRMPRFKENNELNSLLHSESVIRESDELLQLDNMTVVMFKPDRSMSLRVKTKKGVFNYEKKVMKSRDKTFIESPQFDMEGDRLEFNTETQNGTLNGNVTMVIYNVEKAAAPGAAASEASDSSTDEGS